MTEMERLQEAEKKSRRRKAMWAEITRRRTQRDLQIQAEFEQMPYRLNNERHEGPREAVAPVPVLPVQDGERQQGGLGTLIDFLNAPEH
jgi:hypothetical protein